jgi:hypothetical protein
MSLLCGSLKAEAQSSSSASAEVDIVVIAHRLRKVKIEYQTFGRHLKKCDILSTSDDVRMDRIACAIMKACVAEGHLEPASAQNCFYRRVDSLTDQSGALPDLPLASASDDPAAPVPNHGKDEIIVEGRIPEVRPGLWRVTLTSLVFPPSTVLTRAAPSILPPEHWNICLPQDDTENSMIRLLGGTPERKHAPAGCSAMSLRFEGGRVKGAYACNRSDGDHDARISGRFDEDALDATVVTRFEEFEAPAQGTRPTMTDTSEKVYEIRSRLVAKRAGQCRD